MLKSGDHLMRDLVNSTRLPNLHVYQTLKKEDDVWGNLKLC